MKANCVFEVALSLSDVDLRNLEEGSKVKSHFNSPSFTLLVVLWNSRKDKIFRKSYEKLIRHNISVANIPLSRREIEQLKKGNLVTVAFSSFAVNLTRAPACPLCGSTLKTLPNGVYECMGERKQFCVHMLTVKRKDKAIFSCNDCMTEDIEECDCLNCYVFCQKCNGFIFISCNDLSSIIDKNEERNRKP